VTDAQPSFTFLSFEDVLSLREEVINIWGGTHGIRGRGLLESAVGAAANVALYDEAADICRPLCDSSQYELGCYDGPRPDAALGCQIAPTPIASKVLLCCCPCMS
jgi:hypothetical protein